MLWAWAFWSCTACDIDWARYELNCVTTAIAGAVGGWMRGSTIETNMTVHTRTALTSGTKSGSLLLGDALPLGRLQAWARSVT